MNTRRATVIRDLDSGSEVQICQREGFVAQSVWNSAERMGVMGGMSAAQDESGWADGHVREFARRFAALHRPSWPVLVPDLREALIDSFVLMVVLGQHGDSVGVGKIRSLRTRLATRLAEHHKMPNPTATEFTPRST